MTKPFDPLSAAHASAPSRRTSRAPGWLTGVTVVLAAGAAGAAPQESAPAGSDVNTADLTEVVVSARRAEERLIDVPLTISALTATDFAKRDLKDLEDIAELVPGFTVTSYGAQRARRDSPIFTIRGVVPASAGTRPGAGIFVNGAPAANGQSAYLGDLERVEVIKGPQAAYFGRSTFAGALNLVPRRPASDWHGSIEGVVGADELRDLRASIEGPVVAERLTFRLSIRNYERAGQFDSAADGSDVTPQQSRSAALIVAAKPVEPLDVKLAVLYNQNEDGYPTFAKINFASFNCVADAPTAAASFNPTNQNNFVCGELPRLPRSRIGADFVITPAVYDVFYNNSRNLPNVGGLSVLSRDPQKSDISETLHANLTADWTIASGVLEGYSISYLGAYNNRDGQFLTNSISEPVSSIVNPFFAGAPGAAAVPGVLPFPTFYIFSLSSESSVDHELRIASNPKRRVRGMLGVSDFRLRPEPGVLWGYTFNSPGITFGNSVANSPVTQVDTRGVFGNLAFDVTDQLTLNLEGRYQEDEVEVKNRGTGTVVLPPTIKDTSFMPRASLQYKPTPQLNLFFSYASSTQPQGYNNALVGRPANQAFAVAQTGAGVTYDGEEISMYELGAKGSLLDGRVAFAATLYQGEWTNQVIQQRVVVPTSLDGLPAGNILTLLTNGGLTKLQGLELDATAVVTPRITVNGSLAYNETEIRRYECVPCLLNITGSTSVTGNSLAGSPKFKATLFAEYRQPFGNDAESSWYANGQFIHAGRMYTDETNLAWGPKRNTLDLRVGLQRGKFAVEAFLLNAFDEYYLTVATRDSDIWTASVNLPGVKPALTAAQLHLNNAYGLGLGEPRSYGLRASYRF